MSKPTITRPASGLGDGDVFLTHPDTGNPGRWTVVGAPVEECSKHTTVTVVDYSGSTSTWLLASDSEHTVEIAPREAMQRAVVVLGLLLGDDYSHVPLIGWNIDELTGHLSASLFMNEAPVLTMRAWAEALDAEVTETERGTARTLSAKASIDGVPIRLNATIYAEAVAAAVTE